MKISGLISCMLFIISAILPENDACHYVRRRRGRGKRQTEDFVIESRLWRLYFAECMASFIGDPRFNWNTNIDYTVLDSLWYLETDQISCSASVNMDTGECWKFFLSSFIDPISPFLNIGRTCIDSYVNDTAMVPPILQYRARSKRQAEPQPVITVTGERRTEYTNCIEENVEADDIANGNIIPGSGSRDSLRYDLLANFIEDHTTFFSSSVCNPSMDINNLVQPDWTLRFKALTRPDSILRESISTCNEQIFPPANFWSTWSPFSDCPGTCGVGVQVRSRSCRSGIEHGFPLDDSECTGSSTDRIQCGQPCPNVWSSWQQTSTCRATCGNSFFTRQRFCLLASDLTQRLTDSQCFGGQSTETSSCNLPTCPPPDFWVQWSSWTRCSVTCGPGGRQSRVRTCQSGVNPSEPGQCVGSGLDGRDCFVRHCMGSWANWGSFSVCNRNCLRTRNRMCSIPGRCQGAKAQTSRCSGSACMPQGPRINVLLFYSWSSWAQWTNCQVTFGSTFQTRNRVCMFVGAHVGDRVCVAIYGGESTDTRMCPG